MTTTPAPHAHGPATAAAPARQPHDEEELQAMTFPHLLVRELIALLALSVPLVVVSIYIDAPLEEMANPEKTPNPAKAPWYFLGLQELLHYYPPVISGVLLPGLVIVLLAIIPYFDMNRVRAPMFMRGRRRKAGNLWLAICVLTIGFMTTGAHPVWPIIGPLWMCGIAASIGLLPLRRNRSVQWLRQRSLPFWIFTWFMLCSLVLTVIGVYFRGPGWSFTLPWRDGVF